MCVIHKQSHIDALTWLFTLKGSVKSVLPFHLGYRTYVACEAVVEGIKGQARIYVSVFQCCDFGACKLYMKLPM